MDPFRATTTGDGLSPRAIARARGVAWLFYLAVGAGAAACSGAPTPDAPDEALTHADDGPVAARKPTTISAEDVLFGMRGKEQEARRCFGVTGDTARATAQLSWHVATSGEVRDVQVEHSTTAAEVDDCLKDFVAGLHYGRRESPGLATWTFVHGLADRDLVRRSATRKRRRQNQNTRGALVDASSPGTLPTDQIESVAEHGFRLYAFCLREGLNREPKLSGRVVLKFTIDARGWVTSVSDAGSDLPDLTVIDCVAQGFYAMRFPKPAGGAVRLSYAVVLNED